MWILITPKNYFNTTQLLSQRSIAYVNPCDNLIAIPHTTLNAHIALLLALRDGCGIEEVGLDRVVINFQSPHPKRITKMV